MEAKQVFKQNFKLKEPQSRHSLVKAWWMLTMAESKRLTRVAWWVETESLSDTTKSVQKTLEHYRVHKLSEVS